MPQLTFAGITSRSAGSANVKSVHRGRVRVVAGELAGAR
jgi:hypothetical protein